MDASAVLAVPLLRSSGSLQRHPHLHRLVRVDDRLWELCLLLQISGFFNGKILSNDVATEFARFPVLRCVK